MIVNVSAASLSQGISGKRFSGENYRLVASDSRYSKYIRERAGRQKIGNLYWKSQESYPYPLIKPFDTLGGYG